MKLTPAAMIASAALSLVSPAVGWAQTSSIYRQPVADGATPEVLPPPQINASRTYLAPPPVKKIGVHDIVSIRVDQLSQMQSEGDLQRRKNALYDAVLADWVRLDGLFTLKPARQADGDPRVNGQLTQLYRAEADMETRNSLTFNIAAEVVDVLPSGNLVLEAHSVIRNNEEKWIYSLSGVCRPADIDPFNVVLSRNILHLHVDKREYGSVTDGYRRGWITRLVDQFNPF